MATVVMSVEGVLTTHPDGENILHYEAHGPGRVLFDLLKGTSRIVLLSSDSVEDRVKAWLIRERLSKYAHLYCYPTDSAASPAQWRVERINDLLGIGHHVSYYIDTDPIAVQQVIEAGVDGMLVAYTGTSPGHLLGDKYRPWYDLVESIEHQTMLRSARAAREEDATAQA